MDRGAWGATVHGVAKSRTRLSDFTHSLTHFPHFLPASIASHHLSFPYTLFFFPTSTESNVPDESSDLRFLYICREAAEVTHGAESLHCKRVTPIFKGTKQHQHRPYLQNFLLFKPCNFHPLMRFSVSDSASYYTEKTESIMKKFFLNLNLVCILSWPPFLPSQPLTSLSLQFCLDHIPFPFLRILKQPIPSFPFCILTLSHLTKCFSCPSSNCPIACLLPSSVKPLKKSIYIQYLLCSS